MTNNFKNLKIAAAILAGGKTKPIGNLSFGSSIEVKKLINILQAADFDSNDILIVADDPIPFLSCDLKIISDLRKNKGPLAGIESALECYSQKYHAVLLLPSDVQNLTVQDVIDLKKAYVANDAKVVFAQTTYNGNLKNFPLCAVVNCSVLDTIKQALDFGENHALSVWRKLDALTVNCNTRNIVKDSLIPDAWKKPQASNWFGILFDNKAQDKKDK